MSSMNAMFERVLRLLVEDDGQDLLEYALLTGIVGAAAVAILPVITGKMGTAYTNWQQAAQNAWEPCAPGATSCP